MQEHLQLCALVLQGFVKVQNLTKPETSILSNFPTNSLHLGKLQVQSVVLSRIAGIELMTGQRASFEHLPAGGETHSSRWELNVTKKKLLLQSGASSRAKHGGAYFSAVFGSIEDPMAAIFGWQCSTSHFCFAPHTCTHCFRSSVGIAAGFVLEQV